MRKIRQPIASRNDGPPMITQKGWITIIIILMALCLFASYLILDYTLVNIQLHAWDGHQIPHNGWPSIQQLIVNYSHVRN